MWRDVFGGVAAVHWLLRRLKSLFKQRLKRRERKIKNVGQAVAVFGEAVSA